MKKGRPNVETDQQGFDAVPLLSTRVGMQVVW
jgi:hypothetical protein